LRDLLDTHILIRWLTEPTRLSPDQRRILREVLRRREVVAVSAITLLEIALLFDRGPLQIKLSLDEVFQEIEANPVFRILPLTIEISKEVVLLGASLRDPHDRVIVATARVHGLRLLTSDERILASRLISTVA
jgi:PIN domain nuclease of toxin-antitoxin system